MKVLIKKILGFFRPLIFRKRPKVLKLIYVFENLESEDKKKEVLRRLSFFDSNIEVQIKSHLSLADYFNYSIIGFINGEYKHSLFFLKREYVFDFDYEANYIDGWKYHELLRLLNLNEVNKISDLGKRLLTTKKAELKEKFSKAYIFGTGPSLERAIDRDWSDGIRIVSNTIVKDPELWNHINPHFIVAGDAIYHFGITEFSKAFRHDLKKRLRESDTLFVFPEIFLPFCLHEFSEFKNRLISVPQGQSLTICKDLTEDYSLPALGNVLPFLLLPLACTLSRNVLLWGFDGRSPSDKLFWKNSDKHFYTEHVDNIMKLHPAFFNKLVPKNSPESYVKTVHGDVLENGLVFGERQGFNFEMMHFSYTENLNKRYAGDKEL